MTYLSTVLADNPLHYWRFADGASFICHDIGSSPLHLGVNVLNGGYSGIESNAGSMVTNQASGLAQFRDNSTYVTPITLECWFWQLDAAGAEATLIYLGTIGGTRTGAICIEGNQIPACHWQGTTVAPASPVAAFQTWHHLVMTYDESNIRLYLDGTQIGIAAKTGHSSNAVTTWVGRTPPTTAIACGFLAEGAVYGTALSAARVAAHFAAAGPLFPPVGGIATGTFSFTTGLGTVATSQLNTVLNGITSTYLNNP